MLGGMIGFVAGMSLIVSAGLVEAADKASVKMEQTKVVIKTKFGDMEVKLFPDKAPNHVQNFMKLAKSGFYDKTIFHRVIPGFMIQGGDPNTKDPNKPETYGMGGPAERLKAEFNDIPHRRGIVSMARANDPNSAGSQFFIVVKDSYYLDTKCQKGRFGIIYGCPYTVFGEVVKGIEVADKIVSLPRNERDLPRERVEVTVVVE